MLGLIDTLLERIALGIERVSSELDELVHRVLSPAATMPRARLAVPGAQAGRDALEARRLPAYFTK